jgi:hypothetical protein
MYFPKNKIKTGLFSNSGEYITANGGYYTGYYYELPNGRKFTGRAPGQEYSKEIFKSGINDTPPNEPPSIASDTINGRKSTIGLFPGDSDNPVYYLRDSSGNRIYRGDIISTYLKLKSGTSIGNPPTFFNPISFTPQPTQEDYNFGTFERYFVVKANEDIYIEVSKNTYNKISREDPEWNFRLFVPFFITWTLTGDEPSVKNTNKNIVELTEKRLNRKGLSLFFSGRYLEFYSLNPGIILQSTSPYTRYYPDNILIPEKLPPAYQLGNKFNETPNKNIPEKQNCSNCTFNLNGNCSKWKASIRSNYWCKAYKGTYGVGELLNMTPQPMDPAESQPTLPSTYTPPTTTSTPPTTPTPTPSPSTGGGSIGGGGYSGGGGGY